MEVIVTDQFIDWYRGLGEQIIEDVGVVVELLERRGVQLGFPYSSALEGSNFALRELRVQSSGRPIRVFYAFDPARDAVLLLGGDKTGVKRFYEQMISKSEAIWKEYLDENF